MYAYVRVCVWEHLCVQSPWCGGCLCGPGLVKLRAVMDVNRLASSYCVNINHQAWTPAPKTSLLNIHNTMWASEPPDHRYPNTCRHTLTFYLSQFTLHLTIAHFLMKISFSFNCNSLSHSLCFYFIFFFHCFMFDNSLAVPHFSPSTVCCLSSCPLLTYQIIIVIVIVPLVLMKKHTHNILWSVCS